MDVDGDMGAESHLYALAIVLCVQLLSDVVGLPDSSIEAPFVLPQIYYWILAGTIPRDELSNIAACVY